MLFLFFMFFYYFLMFLKENDIYFFKSAFSIPDFVQA